MKAVVNTNLKTNIENVYVACDGAGLLSARGILKKEAIVDLNIKKMKLTGKKK
ncbi:hypothetical protein [Methanococcus vannielii]|uniref:hypothetical protein n=1 Tax=Methanococcus vannielii TaxID=2187 RepID=UPI0000F0BF15|nr:hypothetical protein [Methanococcus vannielii]